MAEAPTTAAPASKEAPKKFKPGLKGPRKDTKHRKGKGTARGAAFKKKKDQRDIRLFQLARFLGNKRSRKTQDTSVALVAINVRHPRLALSLFALSPLRFFPVFFVDANGSFFVSFQTIGCQDPPRDKVLHGEALLLRLQGFVSLFFLCF